MESTVLRFCHLLEAPQLTQAIFAETRALLEEKALLLKRGTIVDASPRRGRVHGTARRGSCGVPLCPDGEMG